MTEAGSEAGPVFWSWAIVELLGHRQRAGRVSEQEIAGSLFLRIDIPQEADAAFATEFYGTGSVYSIRPVDEATARRAAAELAPWVSPAALVSGQAEEQDDDDAAVAW